MDTRGGIVDTSRLIAVCTIDDRLDERLLVELLRVFLVDNGDRIDALHPAALAGDVENVRRLVHTISGSASTAGATRLGELARRAEAEAREGRMPSAALLDAMSAEFGGVRTTLRTLYPALADEA